MKLLKKTAAALCAALTISAAASAAPLAPELQVDTLAKTAMVHDGWFVLPERDKNCDAWQYAITDLDHNGRLEVLKARHGWVEGGPMLLVRELSEDGSRMQGEISHLFSSIPDILATEDPSVQPLTTLYDAKDNTYHYIFTETVYHTEYEMITTKYALTFLKGTLHVVPLACFQRNLSGYDGSETRRYYLPAGVQSVDAEIDAARYEKIELQVFPGCTPKSIAFRWMSPDDLKNAAAEGRLRETLAASYVSFAE